MALCFTSCENASHSQIIGMWKANNPNYLGGRAEVVLDFINKNTVMKFDVTRDKDLFIKVDPLPGKSGYYFTSKYTYTYTLVDNKIYISNGTILTIMSKTCLVPDGETYSYSPFY